MTSLQGSLPDTASGLWRMDREYGVSDTRVKHIVIHEAHIRDTPDRHVVYRIDVFTTERNWCVYRRYSEFRRLHDKISDMFKMFKGSFPPKQLSGNLSPAVIEQRRSALEHYLLKIINCHNQEVSSCSVVLRFLDLHRNDVYFVTSGLCQYVKTFGEAIINEAHYFVLSPTQLYCIHKRLRIPNSDADFKADSIFCDLGSLYDFLGRLNKVCIKPANQQDNGIRSEITLLRNVKELHIQTFSVSLIKGLANIQLQMQRLKASQAVTAMKDILIDSVLEKKTQPRPPKPTEKSDGSWRASFNARAIHNSYTIHPWISLLYLDLSHNTIRQLDDSFSLLPNLQEIDLSYNQIEVVDLNYINPALTKFTCTHCNVMKVITKLHENLAELHLGNNKLTELTGFNKLVVLKKLTLSNNSITTLDNIACLTELPRLHQLALHDNPLSKKSSYRYKVLCMFTQACRKDDIIVDSKGFSDKEKRKAKKTRVKGTTPAVPSDLPFFGTSSDQIPTAFASNQDNMWNSILHDESVTSTSDTTSLSAGEVEIGEMGAAFSPTSASDIRSTPSQTRTYDWDPAQAFACSANSTPPITQIEGLMQEQGRMSPGGSSQCLDNTSSCGDEEEGEECEGAVITVKEECVSSLENAASPLSNKDTAVKQFNSSYYSLSGSSEIYSDSHKQPSDTSPKLGASPRTRVNPFGEPAVSLIDARKEISEEVSGSENPAGFFIPGEEHSVESLQLNSDGSEEASEYGTCFGESSAATSDTYDTVATTTDSNTATSETTSQSTSENTTTYSSDCSVQNGAKATQVKSKSDEKEASEKHLDSEVHSPGGSSVYPSPYFSVRSEFDSVDSPFLSARSDFESPAVFSTDSSERNVEVSGNLSEEGRTTNAPIYITPNIPDILTGVAPNIPDILTGVALSIPNQQISEEQTIDPANVELEIKESEPWDKPAETFVVDKPDYDDVIFSGGRSKTSSQDTEKASSFSLNVAEQTSSLNVAEQTSSQNNEQTSSSSELKQEEEKTPYHEVESNQSGLFSGMIISDTVNVQSDTHTLSFDTEITSHDTDSATNLSDPTYDAQSDASMGSHDKNSEPGPEPSLCAAKQGTNDTETKLTSDDLTKMMDILESSSSGEILIEDVMSALEPDIANITPDLVTAEQPTETDQVPINRSHDSDHMSTDVSQNTMPTVSHDMANVSHDSANLSGYMDSKRSSANNTPSPALTNHSVSPPFSENNTSSGDEFLRENKISSLSFCQESNIEDLYDEGSDDSHSENLTFSNAKLQL